MNFDLEFLIQVLEVLYQAIDQITVGFEFLGVLLPVHGALKEVEVFSLILIAFTEQSTKDWWRFLDEGLLVDVEGLRNLGEAGFELLVARVHGLLVPDVPEEERFLKLSPQLLLPEVVSSEGHLREKSELLDDVLECLLSWLTLRGYHQLASLRHQPDGAIALLHLLGLGLHTQFRLAVVILLVELEDVLLVYADCLVLVTAHRAQKSQVIRIVDGLIIPYQVDKVNDQVDWF